MPKLSEGVKYDEGKPRYDLLPPYALSQLVAVYTFGAKKYDDDNWRLGMKWRRVFGAILRHLWAFWGGEETDPESNVPHLAHAAWGCFTLLDYMRYRREFDDRPSADETPRTSR